MSKGLTPRPNAESYEAWEARVNERYRSQVERGVRFPREEGTYVEVYSPIVRITNLADYGEAGVGMPGSTCCPHCGSWGRYVLTFECEDGSTYGAMRGCVQAWPGHSAALRRFDKANERRENVTRTLDGHVARAAIEACYDEDWEVLPTIRDAFLRDVLEKGARYGFSKKQADAVRVALERGNEYEARKREKAAANVIVPTGKAIEISGTIISVKYRDDWDRWVMIVEGDEGWRVWGTVPASIAGDNPSEAQGKDVTFIADVNASDDDAAFGFIKRPRKASFTKTQTV
jgi:hypothetical protein